MKKSRFSEEQIIGFLRQAEAGMGIPELCRSGGFSQATFYKWRAKYGSIGLPKWVDVRWRTGKFFQEYDPVSKSVWTGGTIVGNYRIEVASRIPKEVLQYASAKKGRAIKLMFRILDDDVVLGWCVTELGHYDGDWFEPNYSGDFMPANWYNGKLIEMGWYIDKKTGQRVPTTTGQ